MLFFGRKNIDYRKGEDDVGKLLQVVLTNTYFTFDEVIYQQTHGLAMGSSVSAILAILYMNHVEKKALSILDGHIASYIVAMLMIAFC